jgi:hypothetical protein
MHGTRMLTCHTPMPSQRLMQSLSDLIKDEILASTLYIFNHQYTCFFGTDASLVSVCIFTGR